MLICPKCKSKSLQAYKTNSLECRGAGVILRYRRCTNCGCSYQTIERIKEDTDEKEESTEKKEH